MKEKLTSLQESLNGFLKETGAEFAKSGQILSTGMLLLLLLAALLFQWTPLIPPLIFLVFSIVCFILTAGVVEERVRRSAKRLMRLNLYLWGACLGLIPYGVLSRALGSANSGTLVLGVTFIIVADISILMFQLSDIGKKFWAALDTVKIGGGDQENYVPQPGDVVLCDRVDLIESGAADTREVLKYKDRFLHMLILGPTGCGKTSQVILPMASQDIRNLESGITVLEPKGDLAREVAMMAKDLGRPYLYFDPGVDNCPFFNPLIGNEADVIENAVTTFLALDADSPQFFKNLSEQLVRNSLKVLKRMDKYEGVDGKNATFINMSRLLQNNGGFGREIVQKFSKIPSPSPDEAKENADIASWFLNEYFAEKSKLYENSSNIRTQISKVIANPYLRRILNPDAEKNERNEIDFNKHLEDGGVICISTAQGLLGDLGKFLGYFLILQFKSAVFRRDGNEDNRRAHWLYIDEFQEYSTPGFSAMLTQGRSYRVACILATQARAQMAMGGGRDGKNFVELVSTNARNVVIFPGISADDAKYYSAQFGEHEEQEVVRSYTDKKFNIIKGGFTRPGHPTESVRIQNKLIANFSASEIIYREFGEIVYCIIKDNTVQHPRKGKIKWLDREYDGRLKQMIEDEIVVHEVRHSAGVSSECRAASSGDIVFDGAPKTDPADPIPTGTKPGEEVSFLSTERIENTAHAAAEEAALHEGTSDSNLGTADPWGESPLEDEAPSDYEASLDRDDFSGDPLDGLEDDLI